MYGEQMNKILYMISFLAITIVPLCGMEHDDKKTEIERQEFVYLGSGLSKIPKEILSFIDEYSGGTVEHNLEETYNLNKYTKGSERDSSFFVVYPNPECSLFIKNKQGDKELDCLPFENKKSEIGSLKKYIFKREDGVECSYIQESLFFYLVYRKNRDFNFIMRSLSNLKYIRSKKGNQILTVHKKFDEFTFFNKQTCNISINGDYFIFSGEKNKDLNDKNKYLGVNNILFPNDKPPVILKNPYNRITSNILFKQLVPLTNKLWLAVDRCGKVYSCYVEQIDKQKVSALYCNTGVQNYYINNIKDYKTEGLLGKCIFSLDNTFNNFYMINHPSKNSEDKKEWLVLMGSKYKISIDSEKKLPKNFKVLKIAVNPNCRKEIVFMVEDSDSKLTLYLMCLHRNCKKDGKYIYVRIDVLEEEPNYIGFYENKLVVAQTDTKNGLSVKTKTIDLRPFWCKMMGRASVNGIN